MGRLLQENDIDPFVNAKILLIEDSKDHQFLFMQKLNSIGLTNIIVCETGEQAIYELENDPEYSLIVSDYNLPGKSGIDLIKEMRNMKLEIPIIMITGLGSEKVAVEAMKLGIQDYITKEDFIASDSETIKEIIFKIMLEYHTKQELLLTRRLRANPDRISVFVYRFGERGPEVFLRTKLPFNKLSSLEEENFLIKLGIHYMAATGSGHEYATGLYELPVPAHPKYHALVYAFQMKDSNPKSYHLESKEMNYGIIVILFPVLFRSILPLRSIIENKLDKLMYEYSDMQELDSELISRVKSIFIRVET
ncbi:MAG: response regulator [Candidatus Heimdallarchaeota archaeon]|nr:response regulator [Candidatus Heimdallarchaeota archaeon]